MEYGIRVFWGVFVTSRLCRKRKDCGLAPGIRIMCPNGVTCLSADCCFSELAL